MACQRYYELISARLDGELSQEEERELENHLALCPGCRALAEQLSGLHEDFSALEEARAPEVFVLGVMDRIRGEEQKKKVIPLFRRPQFKAVAGLAACLALCAGLYGAGQLNLAGQSAAPEVAGSALPQEELQTAVVQPQMEDPAADEEQTASVQPQQYGYAEASVENEAESEVQSEITPRVYGNGWMLESGGQTEQAEQKQPQGESQLQSNTESAGGVGNSLQSEPEPAAGDETDQSEGSELGAGVGTVSVVSSASTFSNEQYLSVTYGATPQAPSAVILGSAQSLADYLAAFPQDDLSAAAEPYDESYFESGRLLAVVAETGSGSNRFELAEDGLTREQVTLTEICPQEGTDDMAAWLILAQVGMEFEDGDVLEVAVIHP